MAKKDFISTTNKAFNAIAEATADTRAAEPKEEVKRINLALDPELHNFISILAKTTGKSLTAFINQVLQEYMDKHRDAYELALKFKESLERK